MNKPTRKQIYIALAVLGALLIGYFGLWRESPVIVETKAAKRGPLMETIDAEGRTRYHDRYVVTAPVSGKMLRVKLHEGDTIPKGYLITRVDPSPPRPIDPNQAQQSSVVPQAYGVYSPESGKLTRIFETSERIIEAGTPIAEISKPSKLEIVIDFLSADATRIKPLQKVIVGDWGGTGDLVGRVRRVEPQAITKVSALGVEEQRVDVIADLEEVPRELGGNFKVDARIVLWSGENVLQIPLNAIFRTGDGWSAFIANGGRANLRQIETGHRSESDVEIVKGINEGETVILHPPNSIGEGTRIDW